MDLVTNVCMSICCTCVSLHWAYTFYKYCVKKFQKEDDTIINIHLNLSYPCSTPRPIKNYMQLINSFKTELISNELKGFDYTLSPLYFNHEHDVINNGESDSDSDSEDDNVHTSGVFKLPCKFSVTVHNKSGQELPNKIRSFTRLFFSKYNNVTCCYVGCGYDDCYDYMYTLETLPEQPPVISNKEFRINYFKSLKQTIS